jgi:hypothetical protein
MIRPSVRMEISLGFHEYQSKILMHYAAWSCSSGHLSYDSV